jgi:hypothetical protein
MRDMNTATAIVNRVEDGIWGGFPIMGVKAPLNQATTGVVMALNPKGRVAFVVVVVVLFVVVLFVMVPWRGRIE